MNKMIVVALLCALPVVAQPNTSQPKEQSGSLMIAPGSEKSKLLACVRPAGPYDLVCQDLKQFLEELEKRAEQEAKRKGLREL